MIRIIFLKRSNIFPTLIESFCADSLCWYGARDQFPQYIISIAEAWIQIHPKQIKQALRFHIRRWLLVERGAAARLSFDWRAGPVRASSAAAPPHVHARVVRDWENNLNWNIYSCNRETDLLTVSRWATNTSGNNWLNGEIKDPHGRILCKHSLD